MPDMPPDPDEFIYGEGGRPSGPKLRVVSDRPFLLRSARCPEPETIPPRPWLYGTQILRGFVTVLVAPGGTGKSTYAMAAGLSVAIGRDLLSAHVFECCNTAYINLEDPMDELERRLAALILHHDLDKNEVIGRFFLNSGDERGLTVARVSADGADITHPDVEQLIHEINEHKIGLLIVDPFSESHDLEENSNPAMIKAAKAWRTVARATGCAILLVHHVRKGGGTDIDAARGAKALTDSARVGLVMSPMSEDEAAELGVNAEDVGKYTRLDSAKANMAPRAAAASWFELKQVELGNKTRDYPNGDKVAVLVLWKPASAFGNLTVAQCNEALDAIADGFEGVPYSPRKEAKDRWAGNILVSLFNIDEKRAASMIRTWIRNGVLQVEERVLPGRKTRQVVTVNDTKRPGGEPAPG